MCQAQGIEWSSLAELGLTKALAEFMVAMAILKHSETNLKSSAQLCCQRPLCKCLQPTTAPRCLSLVPFLAPWYRSSGPKVLPACICTERERERERESVYIYIYYKYAYIYIYYIIYNITQLQISLSLSLFSEFNHCENS